MKRIDFENGTVTGNILGAALPMLVAQILNLLYNIVDRINARINEFDVVVIIRGGGATSDLSGFDTYVCDHLLFHLGVVNFLIGFTGFQKGFMFAKPDDFSPVHHDDRCV